MIKISRAIIDIIIHVIIDRGEKFCFVISKVKQENTIKEKSANISDFFSKSFMYVAPLNEIKSKKKENTKHTGLY